MKFSQDPINTIENLIAKNSLKNSSIYLVVILSAVLLIGLLPIVTVDISSQSRGIVKSNTENLALTAAVSGKINAINIKNNQTVTKGDTLLKISKEALQAQRSIQDTFKNTSNAQLEDLNVVLSGSSTGIQTTAMREEYFKYQAQRNELLSKIQQTQMNYNRNKIMYDKGVIALAEFEKHEFEWRNAKQALSSFDTSQKASWENQKKEVQEKIKTLNGDVQKIEIESKNYFVIAPVSGTIENFSGVQVGSFCNANQSIAIISPNNELIVENTVSPNDIGLLKLNQPVQFQLDAFNYNQWGLLSGKVIEIDKNITLQENEAFFKVKCVMNSKALQLKSGYRTQVSKGMTLTTRFILTRRSLFDLLFDKVDDWMNPKIVNSEK
jgi:membrane fusion protein, peptide pheromone/bacteriocin exporter